MASGGRRKGGCLGGLFKFILILLVLAIACAAVILFRPDLSEKVLGTKINGQVRSAVVSVIPDSILEVIDQKPAKARIEGVRQEVQDAIDAYERVYDEYIEFLKTYDKSNPEMLAQYAKLQVSLVEATSAFEKLEDDDLTEREAAYYLEVQTRVANKLYNAAIEQ